MTMTVLDVDLLLLPVFVRHLENVQKPLFIILPSA